MKNEEKIFKKSVRRRRRRRRKETKERISIQSLVEKITELNEILPEINHPIDKTSMKYLSNLYSEAVILIENITMYMVRNGYCGIRDSIDDTVYKTQELVGILKEFKSLNTSRKARGFINEDDEGKASSLLQSLKEKMSELVALKKSTVNENDSLESK